ncbi:MAG: hypothetical protein IPM29_23130 [Planctomycetes bacterium]|nr:hypothetical protein [Planctomycetota bacterium]
MRPFALIALVTALTTPPAVLTAQVFTDHFNYADGPSVPGWTQRRGTWQIANGRASAPGSWSYLTRDGLSARDCVLDARFFFQPANATQFGGLTARHPGSAGDTDLLMVKVQDNATPANFDRIYCYERGQALGTCYTDIPGGAMSAHGRMIVLDRACWMELDVDGDGYYELATPQRAIQTVDRVGLVGLSGYRGTEIDDFEFFDAVLLPAPGAAARLGARFQMELDTPSPSVPWVGMLSTGNDGFALGARRIPVKLDALLTTSIGLRGMGLVGTTDANGKAALSIPMPQDPAFVGLQLFAAAVTVDATRPFSIGHISNEQAFRIVP